MRPPRVMLHALSHLYLPYLHPCFPYKYGTLNLIALLSNMDALYSFCSSGQCFAFSFLQIPPHDGHPCCSANDSPCRARKGLSPPSACALSGALKKGPFGFTEWAFLFLSKTDLFIKFISQSENINSLFIRNIKAI